MTRQQHIFAHYLNTLKTLISLFTGFSELFYVFLVVLFWFSKKHMENLFVLMLQAVVADVAAKC